jgi:hypothetical protein
MYNLAQHHESHKHFLQLTSSSQHQVYVNLQDLVDCIDLIIIDVRGVLSHWTIDIVALGKTPNHIKCLHQDKFCYSKS